MTSVTSTAAAGSNIDAQEVAKFSRLAARWWDPAGECKPLHDINPLRLDFIMRYSGGLAGKRVIDVGCGGGLLSEAMARHGARVTGIDASHEAISVARLHSLESAVDIDYRVGSAEQLIDNESGAYDVVSCMEMLEHVPDPSSVVTACARLVKPGGHVFFSTINRNPKAYAFAVIAAEYLLGLLPKGTHDYERFIRPSELEAWARQAGLQFQHCAGMGYHPLTGRFSLNQDVSVNYLAHATI